MLGIISSATKIRPCKLNHFNPNYLFESLFQDHTANRKSKRKPTALGAGYSNLRILPLPWRSQESAFLSSRVYGDGTGPEGDRNIVDGEALRDPEHRIHISVQAQSQRALTQGGIVLNAEGHFTAGGIIDGDVVSAAQRPHQPDFTRDG